MLIDIPNPLYKENKQGKRKLNLWTYIAMCIPTHDTMREGLPWAQCTSSRHWGPKLQQCKHLDRNGIIPSRQSTPPLDCQTTDNSEIGIDSEIPHAGRRKRLGKLVPAGSGACLPERDFTHLLHLVRALCCRDKEVTVSMNDLAWVCLATQNSRYI